MQMQAQQHRAVSNSSTRDDLMTAWRPTNGKFDDGIATIYPVSGAKPATRGPRLRALMNLHALTDDDLDKNFCVKCGVEHKLRRRYCDVCQQARIDKGLSIRH